jgi:hypothetical protein
MAKARVLRRQEKAYIELPPDMSGEAELEIFQLKEGYYLLTIPLGQHAAGPVQESAPREKGGISEPERAVLKKLLSIKFENRTPALVEHALSGAEMDILKELTAKGLVNVFRGNKYKDGVYNISDSTYSLVYPKGEIRNERQEPHGPRPDAHNEQQAQAGGNASTTAPAELHSRGFVIIPDKREAMLLSEQLGAQMKTGAIVGVKGFDGKFYIVTREFFTKSQAAINSALKDAMDAPSIASAIKMDPEGCLAVLRLMAENGDIIEKKRGVFAPV